MIESEITKKNSDMVDETWTKENIFFECIVADDMLKVWKKKLFEVRDCIELYLNVIVEIIEIKLSLTFDLNFIIISYKFGELISYFRVHMFSILW